jgi:nitrate/nitrite-specific signal transduction histidine kinase
MPRSFKLKFFILVSIAIVFFAVMTRFTVRGASTKPLHELLYANFASYLEVSVKDSPNQLPDLSSTASSALNVQSLQQLERRILAYYPELSAPKLQLWWGGSENDVQTALLKQVSWRKINQPDPSQAVLVTEGATDDIEWVAFKTTVENRDLFVVVPSDVFQQRFENIMVARETIVNSMWPILLFYIILVTWFLTYWVMRSLQNLQNTFKDIELKGEMKPISEKQFDIEFASFIGYFNQLIHRLQEELFSSLQIFQRCSARTSHASDRHSWQFKAFAQQSG